MGVILIMVMWLASVLISIICIGEIRYRKSQSVERSRVEYLDNLIDSDEEREFGTLKIERATNNFVSTQSLSRRGSWRVAQNNVLGSYTFEAMRDQEYSKKLS